MAFAARHPGTRGPATLTRMVESERLSEIAEAVVHTFPGSGCRAVEWPEGVMLPGMYATRDAALIAFGIALAGRPEALREAMSRSTRRRVKGTHTDDIVAALVADPVAEESATG